MGGAVDQATRPEGSVSSPATSGLLSPEDALCRAQEVGDALCAEAEEHGGGLRWMRRFEHGEDTGYDPDLYGGAAGIGLFLAELAKATDDDCYAAVARGAARWLAGSTWGRGRAQHGFHSGEAGIAYFFVRIAELLEAPGYLDAAVIRLRRLRGAPWQTVDLMYGLAGTLVGTLSVYAATGEPEFLDDALAAAEHLVSERIYAPSGGCYWGISAANLGGPIAPYLGFLHGSAGIGFALAQLAQATGDERYLDVATAAADLLLANAWPIDGSPALIWPRQLDDDSHGVQAHCHGAGGIGQFLLFLDRVKSDQRYRDAAEGAAWAMASRSVNETRSGVCHGLSGSGHLFLDIYQSEKKFQWLQRARECAHRLDNFRSEHSPKKYFVNQQKVISPDLMIGYAGIGGFQLRLADPAGAPDLVLGRLISAP
jgi:lantibiotic modifying enzyme